jgi:hypothetical protein
MKIKIALAICWLTLAAHLDAQVILQDDFSYPNGLITINSSGLWVRHSGTGNDSFVRNGRLEVFSSRADDVNRPFTNSPAAVVYASFVVNMTNLPNVAGNYFGHFNSSTNQRCKLFALTGTDSAPNSWRLGLSAAANSPGVIFAFDLATNVDYRLVVSFDTNAGSGILWIDPSSPGDPNVVTADITFPAVATGFSFRQSSSGGSAGSILVDDLIVGNSFTDAVPTGFKTPTVYYQPRPSVTVNSGASTNLFFVAGGSGLLSFQWQKNGINLTNDGVNIDGATSNRLSILSASGSSVGSYRAVITSSTNSVFAGSVTTEVAQVTLVPVNGFPFIDPISPTNTLISVPISVPFTIGDPETPAASLTVTALSLNSNLVPNTGINLGGSGANRTATISPAFGRSGVAVIRLAVSDGTNITSTSFAVMVRPSSGVVLIDDFDYPDGPAIGVSGGLWRRHSGNTGEADITGGELAIRNIETEDINAALVGAPYSTNDSFVLYSSFKVRILELPTGQDGNYFAHFMDNNLFQAQGFGARVWTSVGNALPGSFRFGIGNGANADSGSGQLTNDLTLNTSYLIVTRFAPSNGVATIWVNPTSENSPGTEATDIGPTNRPNAIDVVAYAFRQNTLEGKLNVDNVRVGLSFAEVMPRLDIRLVNGQPILIWSGSYNLQSAAAVAGPYVDINGATSPYTNAAASATFFRLRGN